MGYRGLHEGFYPLEIHEVVGFEQSEGQIEAFHEPLWQGFVHFFEGQSLRFVSVHALIGI